MNTPAHLIFAAAAFARPHERRRTVAALAGALAPDLSLYLMAGFALFVMQLSPAYVFDTLYFSDSWQMVFKIDNSFLLWGAGLALAWWVRSPTAMVFAAAGLLHLAFDFPLHHDDGRAHFWPLSDWVFRSPLSYWDSRHYGAVIGPIEMLISFAFCVLLFFRFSSLRSRAVICAAALMQLSPVFIWAYIFAMGGT